MIKPTEAIIYLAQQRMVLAHGCQTHTPQINVIEHCLQGHQDCLLGKSAHRTLLVPYIGDIQLERAGELRLVEENQAAFVESGWKVVNPYDVDSILFFEVHLPSFWGGDGFQLLPADIQSHPNQLLWLADGIHIGQYTGREEGVFQAKNTNSPLFVFIIAGVFEVQNRLLHTCDALMLWKTNEVEFEALSDNAILLLIELPS